MRRWGRGADDDVAGGTIVAISIISGDVIVGGGVLALAADVIVAAASGRWQPCRGTARSRRDGGAGIVSVSLQTGGGGGGAARGGVSRNGKTCSTNTMWRDV